MARAPKYQLPSSRSGGSNWPYWLATLLLLAVLGWIWFRTGKHPSAPKPATVITSPKPPVPPPPPATRTPARAEVRLAPDTFPRPAQNPFETQVALARRALSSGSLDGRLGTQTRAALRVFQRSARLPSTGVLDAATRARLLLEAAPLTSYRVAASDLVRLQPLAGTWLGKSQQSALDYETLLELVAEKFHAHPACLRALNPGVNWSNLVAGAELRVPDAAYPAPIERAAFIRISLAGRTLQAFGAGSNLLAHFPCSIAHRVEQRPVGELHVAALAPNPNYTFNPEVFPESPEAQALGRKLLLPPGPNNPVGVAWISLDRAGYGIHGTPGPEQVGRTESHGCFRLANWNAEYLLQLVTVGTPVWVEE